jgi:TPR repeat protein
VKPLLATALLVIMTPAWPADFHVGLTAFRNGDYETAVREWRPLALAGDVEVQYLLARLYYHGQSVRDDAEAVKWYQRAAESGHVQSCNNLGLMYEQGRGVERDEAAAALWYQAAADQGLATAQSNLARLYDLGRGVEADAEQAATWYRRAADQDHIGSQYRLAVMYDTGLGVPHDERKAANWYRRAAKQGHGPSQAELGAMYAEGRGVARDRDKADKWLGRASAQGIAVDVSRDTSPTETVTVALQPLETAGADALPAEAPAETPDVAATTADPPLEATQAPPPPPASHTPGKSREAPPEFPELREIRLRAEAGDAEAQYRLAQLHSTGDGAPHDLEAAARWYRAAAEAGHETAAYRLGFLYLRGRGVAGKDFVQAYTWFCISADLGVGDAANWRDRIRPKLTDKEIAESDRRISEWRHKERQP